MITVYTVPNCPQCDATKRILDYNSVKYDLVDLTKDETAMELVKNLGHKQAPVVIAGDESWSGFRPDNLKRVF